MKYILKEMSLDEKPRAKMKRFGVSNLSDYELIAIIIKSGIKDKSVIDLSIEILSNFTNLSCLEEATLNELEAIKGLGEAKSLELLACIELGKRIFKAKEERPVIRSAFDAYKYLDLDLKHLKQEHFVCIYLNAIGEVIAKRTISIGSSTEVYGDFKDAIKWALKFSAQGLIYAHNHPSGDPLPSEQDYQFTKLLQKISEDMDIQFLDHIIIGNNSYYSFKRQELVEL